MAKAKATKKTTKNAKLGQAPALSRPDVEKWLSFVKDKWL